MFDFFLSYRSSFNSNTINYNYHLSRESPIRHIPAQI